MATPEHRWDMPETEAQDALLVISLPGVTTAADVEVDWVGASEVEVQVPGFRRLRVTWPHAVVSDAVRVKFSKKRSELQVTAPRATFPSAPTASSSAADPAPAPSHAARGPTPHEVVEGGGGAREAEEVAGECWRVLEGGAFVVVDRFLPPPSARALHALVAARHARGDLQAGEVEGGKLQQVRGDHMAWVDPFGAGEEEAGPLQEYAAHLDLLLLALSEQSSELGAFPNLMRDRAMMTVYPPNAVYVRHVDNQSPGNRARIITAILYLNEAWTDEQGGHIRIHPPMHGRQLKERGGDRQPVDICPVANRLVLFWSDGRAPHEVLSAVANRYAVSFWYYDGDRLEE